MNRLLKLDTGSAKLLAEKQQLLQNEISETSEKLNALKEAEKKVAEKEDALPATTDDKDAAKKEIDKLPNLKPEDKKEAKDAVDKAKTKGEVAKAVEEAKVKAEVPTPAPTLTPTPSYPRYDYNPFWHIYFGSGTATTNKTVEPQKKVVMKLQSKLVIGSKEMIKSVDGVEQKVMMDIAPFIDSNRTMLPIRNIARALGLKDGKDIIWNAATRTVVIKREIEK